VPLICVRPYIHRWLAKIEILSQTNQAGIRHAQRLSVLLFVIFLATECAARTHTRTKPEVGAEAETDERAENGRRQR